MRITGLRQVVDYGLCTGCGACASLAQPGAINMAITRDGFLRPQFHTVLGAAEEARLLAVCPGSAVGEGKPSEPSARRDTIFGSYQLMQKAYARDPEARFKAATGGALTALAMYLIDSGEVDAVLHTAATAEDPTRNYTRLSHSRGDIIAAASSRYAPASPLDNINHYLEGEQRIAFIGKPCDVAALRRLATVDDRVNRTIPIMMAMFCGAVPSIKSSHNIIGKFGLTLDEVSTLRYRGYGWPGPTHVATKSGEVYEQTYDETWFGEMKYSLMFRCTICADSTGEHADIAAGDCWDMRDGKPDHSEARDGVNFVLARTTAGARILKAARNKRFLDCAPFSAAELAAMHDDHALRKRSIFWRLLGLSLLRQPATRFHNLRVVRAGVCNASLGEACKAVAGMVARVVRRRNREDARPA